ncbi:type II secretion system minor pseudopilin GspK [Escherichia coli]|nr:type II secretion system minor pseudopilin GspK [Escherichia coli]
MNNEQRGVALLIVLMLLALMAALAADMTLSFHSQLQRTRQVNHHLQRQYDIELAEKLALASLTQDVKDNDRQTTLQQYWAQPQQLQLEDGNTVKWQLRDAQHCFNLNALAKISDDPLASPDFPAQVFSALLINAGIDRGNTDEIVQSIADYIDVDDSPRFHGAEDSFYQSQTPPRHSTNQMLFLTGELRQIKGITENIYQRLIPYVCVLPTTELSINLNMLTENDIPLFRALFLNNITDADARVLLQKRPREGWLTTDAFLYWAQQDFSGVKPLVAQVKRHLFPYSRYFTLSTESISDEQSQGWQSHIFFNRKQQSAQIYRRTLQLY